MKITDVRPVLLTHPYGTGPEGQRSACFVEVETDAGITGVGETYAGVYVPEVAASIVELFKPLILGQDPTSPEAVYRMAYRATSYFGRTGLTVMVLSAIENALWDIAGQPAACRSTHCSEVRCMTSCRCTGAADRSP